MFAGVRLLLRESEAELNGERRSNDRIPFTRPVKILSGRNREQASESFSRDISANGMGVIGGNEFEAGEIAYLVVHSIDGCSVTLKARVEWSCSFGEGWFITGWAFMD